MAKKTRDHLTLILSDQHIPFMDPRADELTVAVARKLKPDRVVMLGDLFDFWKLGRFRQNPLQRLANLGNDRKQAVDYLRKWRELTKELIFVEGNHEDRMQGWRSNHPELDDFEEIGNRLYFKIDEIGIDRFIKYTPETWTEEPLPEDELWLVKDRLYTCHGHRTSINAGKVCIDYLKQYACSGITAHNHKVGSASQRFKREACFWWENGCLSYKNPDWQKMANWIQGFTTVNVNGKEYGVDQARITPDYKCSINGIRFDRKGAL